MEYEERGERHPMEGKSHKVMKTYYYMFRENDGISWMEGMEGMRYECAPGFRLGKTLNAMSLQTGGKCFY